jgi:hypothetical protein
MTSSRVVVPVILTVKRISIELSLSEIVSGPKVRFTTEKVWLHAETALNRRTVEHRNLFAMRLFNAAPPRDEKK